MSEATIYIILAAIFISSEAIKRKVTNWKPLSCEKCLAFWLTLFYGIFVQKDPFLYLVIVSLATGQLTKIVNILLIRLYGNIITK